jgi:hypothetical protein
MEINKYTDIMGVVVQEDIPEGRMVVLMKNTLTADFGSKADLPGVRIPYTAGEAANAKYIVTWPVNNSQAAPGISMFVPTPSFSFAMRAGGWDQASNVPFSATVYLTYPGHQHGVTIPSGYQALAFDKGVFTVPSGHFQYNAAFQTLGPGAKLKVLSRADGSDAGKLAYDAAGTIAVVERFDVATWSLTFRTL